MPDDLIDPIAGNEVPNGKWFLAHDRNRGDWGLWWRASGGGVELHVIGTGKLMIPPLGPRDGTEYGLAGLDCYVIDEQRADQCVMAALAFAEPEHWHRFAARMVGAETCPTT